jgi:predicted flap endonuclease-1-like 5' DNA nuclease
MVVGAASAADSSRRSRQLEASDTIGSPGRGRLQSDTRTRAAEGAPIAGSSPRPIACELPLPTHNVSIILAFVVIAAALVVGYAIGRARRGAGTTPGANAPLQSPAADATPAPPRDERVTLAPAPVATPAQPAPLAAPDAAARDDTLVERARLVRSYEAEAAMLRRELASREAAIVQLGSLAEERRSLLGDLATARANTARYRQLVIDLENDAVPPFFGAGAPDDLKLIVGVGPVLERMLQMLGIATYRQIARWSERDIDEIDAKLHEFPGRIRRDAWVTQARALHQSKYGEVLPSRERR